MARQLQAPEATEYSHRDLIRDNKGERTLFLGFPNKNTVKALASGHPREKKKVCVT